MRPLAAPRVLATVKLKSWWKPKAANLMGILYAVMWSTHLPFARALFLSVLSIATILGIGSFGHIVNDWFDIDADKVAGKANRLASLASWKRFALTVALLALALSPWLVLPADSLSFALLGLEFALLLAYPMPPFRLKASPVGAILADAGYAYAVPSVLAAHTFFLAAAGRDKLTFLACLLAWQSALGVRHFLNHLALDRNNDLRSGTETLATRKGNRFVHELIRKVILPIECAAFLAYLVILGRTAPLLVGIIGAVIVLAASYHILLTLLRGYPWFTCRFSKIQADWIYQNVLPLVLIACLILDDRRFLVVLAAHAILFHGGAVARFAVALFAWPALLVGNRLERLSLRVKSLTGPAHSAAADRLDRPSAKVAGRPSIAVVSIHRDKYTETFIDGLVSRLPYNIYRLHGGELPIYDDDDRYLFANLEPLAHLLEVGLRLDKDHFLKHSIAGYLQARRIRLILAEFGPVGARISPLAADLGIPLVVCFHGYDVFNRETLREWADGYAGLFRQAARIIAVSEIMMAALQQLGAPREKLVHLPAFVDLEKFPPSDHSSLPPRFLAVGRFAETKSPHLTILAFQRIVEVIPEATLTLVGKGGGGELFEACVILVKALGLEDRVEFKGALSHEDVAAEMRKARVFVQHSVTTPENGDMEGKPVAIIEAMASGLPVVATRHSGIVELIEDEVTGLLVSEYAIEAMAQAMIRLATDDDLARRLGHNASGFIHQHPLISRHIEILDRLLGDVIAQA